MSAAAAGMGASHPAHIRAASAIQARISVAALLAGAGIDEFILDLEGLEPRRDAGFLVDMAAEVVVVRGLGRADDEGQAVLSRAFELDVVPVVRTVVGH